MVTPLPHPPPPPARSSLNKAPCKVVSPLRTEYLLHPGAIEALSNMDQGIKIFRSESEEEPPKKKQKGPAVKTIDASVDSDLLVLGRTFEIVEEFMHRTSFERGAWTPDGAAKLKSVVTSLLATYSRNFETSLVVEGFLAHPKLQKTLLSEVLVRAPSFFEIRYRHGSATGKALSPKCFSSAIYTEVVKIFNALNLKREKPLMDLLADIIEHGDVVVPMA